MGLSYLGDWLSEKGKEKTRQKPRKKERGGGVPVYHRAALPQLLERCMILVALKKKFCFRQVEMSFLFW